MRTGHVLRVGVVVTLALGGTVALASPAAAASMDAIGVAATSPTDTSDEKSVTAYCPPGTRVVGGGAVMGGNIDVHLTGMQPNPVANSFTAFAREHGPGNWPWYVTANAICAPEPAGLVYVSEFTGGDSSYSHTDYAWCPAGRKVLGVGGRVTAADTSKLFLTYVKPTGTGNGAEVGAVEMQGGYSGNWWLHSWAICANEPAGWDVVAATSTDGERWASFLCPFPKKLTGGGAYISLSLGEVYLTKIRIDYWVAPDISGSITAGGDPARNTAEAVFPGGVAVEAGWIGRAPEGTEHDWHIKAYGICVD
jgi:hypothetical protein